MDSQPTVGHGVVIQVGVGSSSCVEVMDKMFRMPEPMVFVQLGYSTVWRRNSMGKRVAVLFPVQKWVWKKMIILYSRSNKSPVLNHQLIFFPSVSFYICVSTLLSHLGPLKCVCNGHVTVHLCGCYLET